MDDNEKDLLRDVEFALTDRKRYRLVMWDSGRWDRRGQTIIGYELSRPDGVVFRGEDFGGSPLHANDSDETVRSLMNFLTLRPGDTDREHFDDYTPPQWAFVESDAEELSAAVDEPLLDSRPGIWFLGGRPYCLACAERLVESGTASPEVLLSREQGIPQEDLIFPERIPEDAPIFCTNGRECLRASGFNGEVADHLTFLRNALTPAGRRHLAEELYGRGPDVLSRFYEIGPEERREASQALVRRRKELPFVPQIAADEHVNFSLACPGERPFVIVGEPMARVLRRETGAGGDLFPISAPTLVPMAAVADEHVRLTRYCSQTAGRQPESDVHRAARELLEVITDSVDPEEKSISVDRFIDW